MTLQEALWRDPLRMSGAICFRNTRVPVTHLFAYLPDKIEEFYDDFAGVTPEQIAAVLKRSGELFSGEDLIASEPAEAA